MYISSVIEVYVLKNGYQNLWEKIVESENITIHFNTKVTRLSRRKVSLKETHSYISNVATQNTKTNSSGERVYNFLIWTPEMKESLPLWNNHFGKEAEYFNKTHVDYYTTALIETINETRSISPETHYIRTNHTEFYDDRVIAQRDSYSTIYGFTGPLYQNGTYPISKDNSSFMTTVNYFMAKAKKSQSELRRKFMEHKQYLKANQTNILEIQQWRFFPRYSSKDIESGILWKILEIQGKYGMWYAGSSVCFETVKSVTEYNKILMSNMEIDTKNISATATTTVDSTGTENISTTATTTADSTGTENISATATTTVDSAGTKNISTTATTTADSTGSEIISTTATTTADSTGTKIFPQLLPQLLIVLALNFQQALF